MIALAELLARTPSSRARLIIAGGYDARLSENMDHLKELKALVNELGVGQRVYFLPSFTDR